jgi:preprotein translocase subunit SecB
MTNSNQISLKNILLLESNFTRTWTIDFDSQDFENNVDIDVENIRNDPYLNVIVNLYFNAGVKDDLHIKAFVKMIGVFQFEENDDIQIEQFSNVNAPAIIFPFVREHLSSLSVKAGLSPILLAPVNFVKLSEEKK